MSEPCDVTVTARERARELEVWFQDASDAARWLRSLTPSQRAGLLVMGPRMTDQDAEDWLADRA